MSKKKSKPKMQYAVPPMQSILNGLDEIIDLLHVLVEQTKKPVTGQQLVTRINTERPYTEAQREAVRRAMQGTWHTRSGLNVVGLTKEEAERYDVTAEGHVDPYGAGVGA